MTDSPDPTDEADERAARRTVVLVAAAVVAVVIAGVVALAGWSPTSTSDAAGGPVTVLGPRPGTGLATHAAQATTAVVEASGPVVAVVSLRAYVDEATVRDLLRAHGLSLRQVLVAVPGGSPEVTTDVARFVDDQVAEAGRQIVEIESLLPTVDDAAFAAFYADEVARYRAMVAGAGAAAVFGAVVSGSADEIRALASTDPIRLIDVAPAGRVTADTEFTGVRPEERVRAGDPAFRPA